MDNVENVIYDSSVDEDGIFFADERVNLNKVLSNPIFCIADLGLWNGRHSGYKVLSRNLADILTCMEEGDLKFYFDGKDVKCDQCHHDGTNYITFREMREDKSVEDFIRICLAGNPTDEQIEEYTTSLGKYVCEIYGFSAVSEEGKVAKAA